MRIPNKELLPELLYNALAELRPPVDGEVHVTQLIGPALADSLRRKHWDDLEEDASGRLFALFGTGLHAAIANDGRVEHAKKILADLIDKWESIDRDIQLCIIQDLLRSLDSVGRTGIESSLEWQISKRWKLVGTDDHFDESDGVVMDWKTTSVWSVIYADHDWEKPLNLYGYMRRKLGYEVKKLEVWAILRDWQKSKAKYDSGGKYPRIPFVRVQLRLWSMEECEAYINERLELFDGPPVECTPHEKWQKPTVYKVMKKGRKSALIATRWVDGEKKDLLSTADALEAARDHTKTVNFQTVADPITVDGTKVYIQEFKGVCMRCAEYCVVIIQKNAEQNLFVTRSYSWSCNTQDAKLYLSKAAAESEIHADDEVIKKVTVELDVTGNYVVVDGVQATSGWVLEDTDVSKEGDRYYLTEDLDDDDLKYAQVFSTRKEARAGAFISTDVVRKVVVLADGNRLIVNGR
jgi:hypothetical protein